MSTTTSKIDPRALSALVAFALHSAGPDRRFEDFDQNPSDGLFNRLNESMPDLSSVDPFANGMLAGFSVGLRAAAIVASDPLSIHDEEMQNVVKEAVLMVRSYHDDRKQSAA